jgi:hypothetical protein
MYSHILLCYPRTCKWTQQSPKWQNTDDVTDVLSEWILEYRQKRPGLKVLQQQIDEFITAHEEQQEQVCIFHLLSIQGPAN